MTPGRYAAGVAEMPHVKRLMRAVDRVRIRSNPFQGKPCCPRSISCISNS